MSTPTEAEYPCPICGGADATGWGSLHHGSCPYRWHSRFEDTVVIRLNAYQAANLLRLLYQVWGGELAVPYDGDWAGEVPHQLEAKMQEAGGEFVDTPANDGVRPVDVG